MADVVVTRVHSSPSHATAAYDPARQAFWILRIGFTVAPILAGLDKFTDRLVDWERYLAPIVTQKINLSAHQFMLAVGVIEIVAGLIVAIAPRAGGWIVAAWLAGIIANLLMIPGYYDIALRDFGLMLGALALARLAALPRPIYGTLPANQAVVTPR